MTPLMRREKANPRWSTAHQSLLTHFKKRPFITDTDNRDPNVQLPAYLPYVGPDYFEYQPRILCYGINQNLSQHARWTDDWVSRWAADFDLAIDRLNRAAQRGEALPIKPYAEGFIPLVALIALRKWVDNSGGKLPRFVDDTVAVTNFVKFSTFRDASSSSIPSSWWHECGVRYVKQEIQILRPNVIIAFGQRTFVELQRVLRLLSLASNGPELLRCRFPARLASVKSKPLSLEENMVWSRQVLPLVSRIRKPKPSCYHRWKILQHPSFFLDTDRSWHAI